MGYRNVAVPFGALFGYSEYQFPSPPKFLIYLNIRLTKTESFI